MFVITDHLADGPTSAVDIEIDGYRKVSLRQNRNMLELWDIDADGKEKFRHAMPLVAR